MAKYKQVEFARLCGIQKSSIPAYKGRGQIIIKDGLIDEMHPINAAFLMKAQANQKIRPEKSISGPDDENASDAKTLKTKPNKNSKEYADLITQQKQLDIEKTQEEIEKLKKQNMKMDGESMPTDLVKSIFSFYGKTITTHFYSVAENWLVDISKLKNLSTAEYAEMRGLLIAGINEGVTKANAESKKNINNIIKEYSLKREVGEHD